MKKLGSSILIAAVATLFIGRAHGDVDAGLDLPRAAFAETDLNADQMIDIGEFHARLVEVFYNADTNKSGFLEADELAKLPLPETVAQVDHNGDSKVTLREFVRIRFIQFNAADTNDDAELSLDEVIAAYGGRAQ